MNIRIFLLKREKSSYVKRLSGELGCVFGDYLPENGIREFASVRNATEEITGAFRDSHVIIFLAEPAKFAETKTVLAKVLGLKLHSDRTMFEKAAETARSLADEQSEFAVSHSHIPDGAKLFPCGDGLYTGISVSAGNQTIYILPMERGRTETLLSRQILPDINTKYGTGLNSDVLRAYNVKKLADVCEESDIKIAVAGTNTASFFRDYLAADDNLLNRISFADSAEKRGNLPPADYVVNLSITACEFFGTPYGVAISNAFYSGDDPNGEKIIYLAITNEYETALREIISVPGEDVASMLSRCCGDLCTFISDIARTDASKKEAAKKNEKKLKGQYKRAICVIAVLAVLIGAFGAYYFTSHEYSLKTWLTDAWTYVFPGGNPLSVSETEPEFDTTDDATVPVVTTKKGSLPVTASEAVTDVN